MQRVRLNNGLHTTPRTDVRSGNAAIPQSGLLRVNDGESIASITERAYGANTWEYQQKLKLANGRLAGDIIVPK